MSRTRTYTSVFNPQRKVDLDPYDLNPLESDLAGGGAYAAAKASGVPVPKAFGGGESDLPAFLASGLPPEILRRVPFRARHAVAAEPDPAKVYALVEENADNPDWSIPHPGLAEAVHRMSHWASTAGIDPKRDAQRAAAQAADAKRAADLAQLPPDRVAAIHAQVQETRQ